MEGIKRVLWGLVAIALFKLVHITLTKSADDISRPFSKSFKPSIEFKNPFRDEDFEISELKRDALENSLQPSPESEEK